MAQASTDDAESPGGGRPPPIGVRVGPRRDASRARDRPANELRRVYRRRELRQGRWWSLLRDAAEATAVVPGAVLVAGTERFWSVVRIEQVDDDGQVHFVPVPADDSAGAGLLARST